MHDGPDDQQSKHNLPQAGEDNTPVAESTARSSSMAFLRGLDAAGVGLALRALGRGDKQHADTEKPKSPDESMSWVRREIARRQAAKQEKETDGPTRG